MKIKELLKQKKVQYSIVGAILILLIIIFLMITQMNKVKIEFKLNDNVIEYGSDQSEIEWKTRSTTNGNKITVAEFDTKKVGQVDIVFTVCLDETCQEFTEQIEIKDTQAPEIIFKSESLEIIEGDEFDPVSNIDSVKDPIDEDIKQSDDKEITKDGYIIENGVNADQTGEYTVKIIAFDVNGNRTEQSYKVIVKEKPKEPETSVNIPTNNNQSNTGGNQSGNGGENGNIGGNVVEQPHYRADISNTYFTKINDWRTQNGLEPLPHTAEAQAEADRRAMELVSDYKHGASYEFSENIGYGGIGFNFFEAWKASPNHNSAMLEKHAYLAMAVSVVEYNGMWYGVTSFRERDF